MAAVDTPMNDEEIATLAKIHCHPGGKPNAQAIADASGRSRAGIQRALKRIAARPTLRAFEVPILPTKLRSIDEIRELRRAESLRAREYRRALRLIPIKIKTPGPIGIMFVGDPHIDNPGSDWDLFERDMAFAAKRPSYVFAINQGDISDNWVGRLTRLYADHTITPGEKWGLAEWVFRDSGVSWLALILGNHDCWSGHNDPLDWITKGTVGVKQAHGARLSLKFPNGSSRRIHSRHDFPGNSIHNPLHALKRETLHGHRDHIIVAAHRHFGADARDMNGDGEVFVMVRVSGYKISDDYADQIGAHPKPINPSALVVIDPDKPATDPAHVWTAPDVETGVDYLDFLRKKFERRR